MKPIQSFIVSASLPENISKLKELAYNYWWCWNSDAKELFIRINRDLWNEVDNNPVLFLNKLSQEQLENLSEQQDFVSFLDYVHKKFIKYMTADPWFNKPTFSSNHCIAYFSTEYGINESFPNYSGGLGILSGDHLKSASDLGLPLVGVGLLYQQGYFRQHLTQNGWQNELYKYNDFYTMPLILVRDNYGNPLVLDVDLPLGKAYFQVWKLQIGRVPLYLLDTNIDQNGIDEYRDISDQLYGGTRETRIQQEIVLGIGGMRALKAMNIIPQVVHINEGHAAFALLERTKYFMEQFHLDFISAKQITRLSSIFTTHTPVPAGNETFNLDRMEYYFHNYYESLGLSRDYFLTLGQSDHVVNEEPFSMTILGLKLTTFHNGVSKLHGKVARSMWRHIWKCFPENEVPIKSITNGVHTLTWVSKELGDLFDRYLSPRWRSELDNKAVWEKIDSIPNEELWREKTRRRVRLVLFAREYLQKRQKSFIGAEQIGKINDYLDPDALTIGFARRFATYKRANLLFKDMERLYKILTNPSKPVQIIIAGKAHPHDTQGKEVIQGIIQKVREYHLEKYIVFLEDYDMVIARFMVKGCDIWLNTPVRPMEASGTSGMKAGLNGTLNLSILDGWWDEGYNRENGFAIGSGEEYSNSEDQEIIESKELYDVLEQIAVPMFYDRSTTSRNPEKWVSFMKNSIKTIAPEYSTARMVTDYSNEFYKPAMDNYAYLCSGNAQKAAQFKEWKEMIYREWQNVKVISADKKEGVEPAVGKPIDVEATIKLGNLTPADVLVQVYYGIVDPHNELISTAYEDLKFIKSENGFCYYEGQYKCPDNGKQGFTIRVLPRHELMANFAEMYMCCWA